MNSLHEYVSLGLFYKSVVEDGSDIIFIVDYQGFIYYHNASVEETLGHQASSLVGKSFFDFILPDSLYDFKNAYQLSCQRPYQEAIEFQFLCKNKTYKYLEFNSINIKQKEGIQGLILDCRDITQRKKDAEELLLAQKAKEQFLANISHEIRTPINGIAGMATLLSRNPTPDERIIYLNAIRHAADNLKVIINDILDLASAGSGKLQFEKIGFSLTDLLTSLIGSFSIQAREKAIDLSFSLMEGKDVILIGDPVRLNQILINLISNALKFTHQGYIRIPVSIERMGEADCTVCFEVVDTGIGIPMEKLSSIFESFGQADASVTRKYGGTGLGLTIVKQLVELQHGSIFVTSKEGEGSTFRVVIPYAIGRQADLVATVLQEEKSNSNHKSLRNLHVLLVEDNDINRLYAQSLLKGLDCTVESAENGYVAVKKLTSTRYDIVLMDIQMPVMDGFEATKAIRSGDAEQRNIPIVALTANATQADFEKCLAAGMNACVAKPFTPDDLFRVLVKFSPLPAKHSDLTPGTTQAADPPPSAHKKSRTTADLTYLQGVADGNSEFLREMIQTFGEVIPQSVREIQTLLDAREWQALAKVMHKIKPTLTMMGLTELRDMLISLEEQLKKEPGDGLLPGIRLLAEELILSVESLKSLHD